MSNEKTTALAVRDADPGALAMVMEPGEALQRLRDLQSFIAQVMVPGEDYGTIPGTPKPTLYQPGAQKLAEIYGLAVNFEDSRPPIERWGDDGQRPFVAYFKRAVVTRRRDGLFLGAGVGNCNSREKKYAKQDACSVANTIEKMACKRSLVAAVISVTRSSGIFAQDLEDMPKNAGGEIVDAELVENPEPPAPPDAAAVALAVEEGVSARVAAVLAGGKGTDERTTLWTKLRAMGADADALTREADKATAQRVKESRKKAAPAEAPAEPTA